MSFYKYMTTNTGKIVIENSTLRWSSPSIFNDIDECQFSPFSDSAYKSAFKAMTQVVANCAEGHLIYNFYEFSPQTQMMIQITKLGLENGTSNHDILLDMSEKLLENNFSNPEDYFREYVNTAIINCARVLCVTTEHDNDLMWAHYADEHRGCVFEFKNVYKETPDKLRQGSINYVKELKSSINAVDLLLYGETKPINDALVKDVFFSKKNVWDYEKEYRLMFNESFGVIQAKVNLQSNEKEITVSGQSEQLHTDVEFAPESLLSITFGVRTPPKVIDEIISAALNKNPQCVFYQMKRAKGGTVRHPMSI
ncbi:DUF2971 domain-containing protein [Vibrio parahaemolyticus]|nr:DUF2971 domain-containing protein [Vibrio parahaemolyticus]